MLAEAIIIGNKPRFAVIRPAASEGITIEKEVPLNDEKKTILKPPDLELYINKPYTFKTDKQFFEYVERALAQDLDSLHSTVKAIWAKYIDADDYHLSICAADTIFTYYQDKLGMTHYLWFIGDNDSGKSNNLVLIHVPGYRNMMSLGISVANIYTFLGSRDEGVGTICEDEMNDIEEDKDKMDIGKSGYTKGFRVIKTFITPFGRIQYKYNTFCFKAYSSEKFPDPVRAKGLVQRLIKLKCIAGSPQYDILEVMNPVGDEEYQGLLDELMDKRNLLLCYRILHYQDKIPNIKINLRNREKQLFKPVLRMFQGTKTFTNLCDTLSKYVNDRRSNKTRSLHAFLYTTIRDMREQQNSLTLTTGDIWTRVQVNTNGQTVPGRPLSYDTVEFGILSQKGITDTILDIFDCEYSNTHGRRAITFKQNNLDAVGSVYNADNMEIKLES